MREDMITKWNSKVQRGDVVYHLGDFAFCDKTSTEKILNRLSGTIRFIRGNHDKVIKGSLVDHFDWVKDYYEFTHEGRKIVLCHYAFEVWNKSHHGSWHLHGHSHGTLEFKNIKRLDVGVDTNNMNLYSIDDVAKIMEKRGFNSPDQHGQRRKKHK